ncbi:MAG: methyltransferase domain-containing protein [Candidatus Omnitrophica bacterium]|nr:methyltransferase domain-containing protein [Candidatus Omnitrophota bacterium]
MVRSIKVNIGSGPHGKSDWINLDWGVLPILSKFPFVFRILIKLRILSKDYLLSWPSNPRLCDARKKLPFKDNSVNFIYSSHFLEHVAHYQALDVFKECRRILAPSGVLRISVPDLKIVTEKYLANDLEYFKKMMGYEPSQASLGNIADLYVRQFFGYDSWSKPSFLNKLQRLFIRGHLWMYDFDSLSDLLKKAGFTKIERCRPGVGKVPDLDFLDLYYREHSLYVEACL